MLRDATAGQKLVCARDGAEVVCRAGDIDKWMVRMGRATVTDEKLRKGEREAWTAGRSIWYKAERFAQTPDVPPTRDVPSSLPGEDVARACAEARENAFE